MYFVVYTMGQWAWNKRYLFIVMFANAAVDNCTTWVRICIFSLLDRLTTSTNGIVQSALSSDVYTTSPLQQRWIKALYTCS